MYPVQNKMGWVRWVAVAMVLGGPTTQSTPLRSQCSGDVLSVTPADGRCICSPGSSCAGGKCSTATPVGGGDTVHGYRIASCPSCRCGQAASAVSDDAGGAGVTVGGVPSVPGLAGTRGVVMSCPSGQASHNSGDWKPSDLFRGVIGVGQQLVKLRSELQLVVALFSDERDAKKRCLALQADLHGKLAVVCRDMAMPFPPGYGVSKIFAMQKAGLDDAIWMDCDTFPIRDPATLLDDPNYVKTGATFWPDIEGHFDINKFWNSPANVVKANSLFSSDRKAIDAVLFPKDSWITKQGFDSGLIVLNRGKTVDVMARVLEMARNFGSWEGYTSGDKDLWHLGWMMQGQPFNYCPYVGAVGYFSRDRGRDRNKWYMTSQAKFGHRGEVVVMHQLWRMGKIQENFFGMNWPKLGRVARYNPPEITLRIDLRTHADYRYSHDPWGSNRRDWQTISDSLGPDEMYPSDSTVYVQTEVMANLWGY